MILEEFMKVDVLKFSFVVYSLFKMTFLNIYIFLFCG